MQESYFLLLLIDTTEHQSQMQEPFPAKTNASDCAKTPPTNKHPTLVSETSWLR